MVAMPSVGIEFITQCYSLVTSDSHLKQCCPLLTSQCCIVPCRFWAVVESEEASCSDRIFCYLAEQCLLAAQLNRVVFCPIHGNMGPYFIASQDGHVQSAHAAPDAVC